MFQKIILFISIALLTACHSPFVEDDNHQINRLDDYYPIRQVEKIDNLSQVNVIDLNRMTKCQQARAVLSPESLKIGTQQFDLLWQKLITGMSQEKYYIFTYGECTSDGPLIEDITDCKIDTCGEKYVVDDSLLWISTWSYSGRPERPRENLQEYTLGKRSTAPFYVQTPLSYDAKKQAWKFSLMYSDEKVIAVQGYMDNEDFTKGKFIIESTGYDVNGNIVFQATYNNDGKVIQPGN